MAAVMTQVPSATARTVTPLSEHTPTPEERARVTAPVPEYPEVVRLALPEGANDVPVEEMVMDCIASDTVKIALTDAEE